MTLTVGLMNFGCPKNIVDSELMLGILMEKGYKTTLDEDKADIVIVNTCSFIQDAEEESVGALVRLAQAGKKFIVAGCLSQKHKKDLVNALPEASAVLGTGDFKHIAEVIEKFEKGEKLTYMVSEKPEYPDIEEIQRQQITIGSSSYLKIADGCDYNCGYCIIPQLKGKLKSRTIENIVAEAKALGVKGVTEIILIAQDTTNYGYDLYGKPCLEKLLYQLNKIEEIQWIRIMYAYPTTVTDEVIEAMQKCDKVVKYIDIPLQHSHKDMLKSMNRPVFDYSKLIKKLRDKMPNITIRTAFIVGYPGETKEHVEHLYNFIKEVKFDRLGVFEYSKEKNTKGYGLKPQVLKRVKTSRRNKLMKLQQQISKEVNEGFIGKTIPCLVEALTSDGKIIARSYRDAPEIDGIVEIKTDIPIVPGEIVQVKITNADEYDLFGVI